MGKVRSFTNTTSLFGPMTYRKGSFVHKISGVPKHPPRRDPQSVRRRTAKVQQVSRCTSCRSAPTADCGFEAALFSCTEFQPCLTVNPDPERPPITPPSVHITMPRELLLASVSRIPISVSVFQVRQSRYYTSRCSGGEVLRQFRLDLGTSARSLVCFHCDTGSHRVQISPCLSFAFIL